MKKIAVSATGPTLEADVDPRLGHCRYYLLVDSSDLSFEAMENPHSRMHRGAGIRIAKFLSDREADVVLTGHCGPGAGAALVEKGIRVVTGCSGTVREAIERFRSDGDEDTVPRRSTTARGAGGGKRRRQRRTTDLHGDVRA
jgi:predicted Fe-Mo cluster-binding NifX family protein